MEIGEYHTRTKHHVTRHAAGPGWLDWANQPDPFRSFPGAPRHEWGLASDRLETSYAGLFDPGAVTPRALTADHLGLLFEISMAVAAWKSFRGATWSLRCNPSSGNLHPTEAYLACARVPGLASGVHHYSSLDHVLERRAILVPGAWEDAVPRDGVLVGLTSVHWREAWKYGERAFRYCQHDAGHAATAIRFAAAALGWGAWLVDGWSDDDLAHLCGLDRDGDYPAAEREAPDLLLWVGPRRRAPRPEAILAALDGAAWTGTASRLSPAPVLWEAIDAAREATLKPRTPLGPPAEVAALPPLPPPRLDPKAADLFRRRRSAVAFDGKTAMASRDFFRTLDACLPRRGVPPFDALPWSPKLHLLLFVHRVEGLPQGLYLLARRPEAHTLLREALGAHWLWEEVAACPDHLPLRLLLREDLAQAAGLISCQQAIAADSAFSLGMLAEFAGPLEGGAWWYRHLFWEAGMVGQVLYLEAEAAGLRGTGIGCYYDDEVHRLLGLRGEAFQSLYHFAVGAPVEDDRLTTLPPYGHLMR